MSVPVLCTFFVILLIATELRSSRIERKLDRLARKVDAISKNLGIEEVESADLAPIEALLREGKQIAAIKKYREITGAGLQEAKEAVERMAAQN
ncbi:ribosomal protein L7/L12 [Streptomyces sp. TP-A0874]|uniref:ribosomal protein L7/L12 n=1 Tax=Streptomyces sp. TP-A0874 TaxID=549819 RepID=UPI0008531062|nr:ribosomal protein L7/L12 [Streptomyces sp. TP-A0874]